MVRAFKYLGLAYSVSELCRGRHGSRIVDAALDAPDRRRSEYDFLVVRQKRRIDPVGDLSRDAIEDVHHKGQTYKWWVQHLESHAACQHALYALEEAWEKYRKVSNGRAL
jgi:uncharacterized protein YozE (UPF0346 family)